MVYAPDRCVAGKVLERELGEEVVLVQVVSENIGVFRPSL